MTVNASIYERMSMSHLRSLSRQDHEAYDDAATRVYVKRLIDLEVERRLDLMHRRPGWHSCSPGFGDGTGASTAPSDAMMHEYVKGIPSSRWHDEARIKLSTLSPRNLVAVLIQGAKGDRRTQGPFSANYDQIAAGLGHYLQLLGMAPGAKALGWYKTGQAIKDAARQGRIELLLQAKAGV